METGQWLRIFLRQTGGARDRTCDPWIKDEWFIHYKAAARTTIMKSEH